MELASLIKVNNISGARLCGPNFTFVSKKLALTNHFILLVSETEDFYMLHKSIDAVRLLDAVAERRYAASGQQGFTLALYTKTFCIYELTVPTLFEARGLLQSLEALCNIENLSLHYPFFYKPSFPISLDNSIILSLSDYHADALATGRWRLSAINKNFAVCKTYPEELVVPTESTDAMLIESGTFRRGTRFPVLVYYHKPRQTALLLSSEPYTSQTSSFAANTSFLGSGTTAAVTNASTGASKLSSPVHTNSASSTFTAASALAGTPSFTSVTRCRADEQLLAAVLPDRYRGAILDLRDQTVNKRGGNNPGISLESEQYYPQWRRICRPMEPCSQLYATFQKFIEVCTSSRRTVRNASSSFPVIHPSSLSDSLSVLAAAALGPSGPSSTSTSLGAGQFTREVDSTGVSERSTLTFESNSSSSLFEMDNALSSEFSGNPSNRLSAAGLNAAGSHSAGNMRRTAAWLSLVREALAAAVAGATALDARDAFAQQQLQQEQCLLAQKYKDMLGRGWNSSSLAAPVREEAKLRGSFVLVHSRWGFDRALVVASLIRIILDPSSRTLTGLQNLIEHNWIRLGHPFSERLRSAAFAPRTCTELAPVFILFLDCVWQLWRQYPTCFEFTEELLCQLANHAYCSEFGTFLGNSMQERTLLNVAEKTTSFWCYLNQPVLRTHFTNPLYVTWDSVENYACWPCLAPQALAVWHELYQRQVISDPEALLNRPRRLTRLLVDNFYAESKKVVDLRNILQGLKEECLAAGLLPA